MLDMFIMAIFDMPTYVAKREIGSIPVFGCKLCCTSVILHEMACAVGLL